MMNSKIIRQKFKDFFESKSHLIVPSAPMVVKDDPTLMFTNAGMNQFKDYFLGNQVPKSVRIANSQKCLRVSGKHNDLEEVGHDTYHHTMFEMLGNWSFGDYFKHEAIDWAWEFLTVWMGLAPERLYVTIFEGDNREGIERDNEAYDLWLTHIDKSRILEGSKKDNFWEMGDTGPCGPCSEIHVDIRSDAERAAIDGKELVNKNHPQVIEIWNLVFIQYNRKADGSLVQLPQKHVDTGMGFERLTMALQGKQSNYDTDIFQPVIQNLAGITGIKYGADKQSDIAMRVIADHIRAIAFSIADGQLPSNTGAGYVIRRILRRAVRYGFNFLNLKEPFMNRLIPVLVENMGDAFPELISQQQLISRVITEEENSFLRTLETGIILLENQVTALKSKDLPFSGKAAFELYDTYGFPLDLTELILSEKGIKVDLAGFQLEMEKQKSRSRQASGLETADWIIVRENEEQEFVGYDHLSVDVKITRYRQVKTPRKTFYQLVFDKTPFYAESGGQVGDTGTLVADGETLLITDTKKENNLTVHLSDRLPRDPGATFLASVEENARLNTMRNHSATHLLQFALRKVLGTHVEQKGSLVDPEYLRFDFSYYQKMTESEIDQVEIMVNKLIRQNISLQELRSVPIAEARQMGAMALFGEKYGDQVRVIRFGESVELCGGTHVHATGQIGFFRIISESSIASGIRRIEARAGQKAEEEIREQNKIMHELNLMLKPSHGLIESVNQLQEENQLLRKKIEGFEKDQIKHIKDDLKKRIQPLNGVNLICERVDLPDAAQIKDLAYQLKGETANLYLVIGSVIQGKPMLTVMISESLVSSLGLHAGNIIRDSAHEIQGGGGGQPFFATAGGKDVSGIDRAMARAREAVLIKIK
ncbi:MAG: alanine--tRNA ligase [Bacteroidales bacterium]